ncbi:hypothetical protein BDR26DRAFT_925038 [Obelidium mucronatum]|nr:hypothetical protein BDR26DRAFT_925038 [Obelidium mucronatum]
MSVPSNIKQLLAIISSNTLLSITIRTLSRRNGHARPCFPLESAGKGAIGGRAPQPPLPRKRFAAAAERNNQVFIIYTFLQALVFEDYETFLNLQHFPPFLSKAFRPKFLSIGRIFVSSNNLTPGTNKLASPPTQAADYATLLLKPAIPDRGWAVVSNQMQVAPIVRLAAEHGRLSILITSNAGLFNMVKENLVISFITRHELLDIGLKGTHPLATMVRLRKLVLTKNLQITDRGTSVSKKSAEYKYQLTRNAKIKNPSRIDPHQPLHRTASSTQWVMESSPSHVGTGARSKARPTHLQQQEAAHEARERKSP